MAEHILRRFDEELDKLKTRLIRMGSIVQEQIEFMIRALENNDVGVAKLIISQDEKVDRYDVKIDKLCMRLFALQQPVAMDLRLIMSALTINNNLERLGDLAVNVAERIESLSKLPGIVHRTKLIEMGRIADRMVNNALDAFINNDPEIARGVIPMDDDVDLLDRENFRLLISIMQSDPSLVEVCSHLLIVNRNIERIADQATNIAEEVVFLVDAHIIKHRALDMEDRAGTSLLNPPSAED